MANLFDVSNAPEGEPTEIVVGDFIQWKRSDLVGDYPPASHSAEYVARIKGGGSSEDKLADPAAGGLSSAQAACSWALSCAASLASGVPRPGSSTWSRTTKSSVGRRRGGAAPQSSTLASSTSCSRPRVEASCLRGGRTSTCTATED